MDRPLGGYSVVEIGHSLPVVLLGRLLAQQGARVCRLILPSDECQGIAIPDLSAHVIESIGYDDAAVAGCLTRADVLIHTGPGQFDGLGIGRASQPGADRPQVRIALPAFPTGDGRTQHRMIPLVLTMTANPPPNPANWPRIAFPDCCPTPSATDSTW